MNTFKTALLLTSLTLFLVFLGQHFGGRNGMIIALAIAVAMNFFSYFYSDKLALSMYKAQPATREQLPRVYSVVEQMTQRFGLPMPKIYVIPTESPNAFATGRSPKHASVAVTQGILNLLTDDELAGVLAHELGHVRNRDILTSSIAATLAGAITILAQTGRFAMMFGGYGGRGGRDRDGGGIAGLFMLILAPIRGNAYPACRLALPRVRGRRHRRTDDRQSLCPGQCAGEAGHLFAASAHARHSVDCTSVHRAATALPRQLR